MTQMIATDVSARLNWSSDYTRVPYEVYVDQFSRADQQWAPSATGGGRVALAGLKLLKRVIIHVN